MAAILGWYMTVVIIAAEVGFPIRPPCGELSRFWPQPGADVE